MRFQLFTEKTVSQCMRDLGARLQAKPTKTRPELGGWIKKSGEFNISIKTPVVGKVPRRTKLSASAKRERGVTIINGYVPDGISPQWVRIMAVIVLAMFVLLMVAGEPMLALLMLLFAFVAYVPLRGDYVNSDLLLIEVEKTLKASPKPPKK